MKSPEEIENDVDSFTEGLILTHTQRQIIRELLTIANGLQKGKTRMKIMFAVYRYIDNLYDDDAQQSTNNQEDKNDNRRS